MATAQGLLATTSCAQGPPGDQEGEAQACPPPPITIAPTSDEVRARLAAARDRGFLWRITRDGRTSYLYGTLHVLKQDWMYPGPIVLDAVRGSDRLALEIDVLDPDTMRRLATAIRAGSDDVALPEPLAQRIRARAERDCVPSQTLATMFPEMQIATIALIADRRDGLYGEYGVDFVLAGMARGMHKPTIALETPEGQMEALRAGSSEERIAEVEKSLGELDSGPGRMRGLRFAQAWAEARLDDLERYPDWCECFGDPDDLRFWHRVIEDRNPGLADHIAAIHEAGQTVFAAVGSLHMVGPAGVPALLAKRGYQVEFVTFRR